LAKAAKRFSSSVRTVIADIATAARDAANKLDASSGGTPTVATDRVPKDSSTIAIASGRTGAGCGNRNRA